MAAPNDLETSQPGVGNEGDSSPDTVATFTEAVKLATAGAIDLTAGLVDVAPQNAYARCKAGSTHFAYGIGLESGVPGTVLLYTHVMGMEVGEWVSWFFKGTPGLGAQLDAQGIPGGPYAGIDTGMDLVEKLLLNADPTNPFFLPVLTRTAEGAGWYKEAVTLKKFEDGKWADGSLIKLRQFGDAMQRAMNIAFPNIYTPPAVTGGSPLTDILNGVWNGIEYNEPFGDMAASLPNVAGSGINGLFPNWPSGVGSIVDLGLKYYYMASWHSPARVRNAWINRTYWNEAAGGGDIVPPDALHLSADDRKRVKYAAMASCLQNIAISYQGQDALIKRAQELGAVVYQNFPRNVSLRLREASTDAQDISAYGGDIRSVNGAFTYPADATGAYPALLQHQRLFTQANHVRWGAQTEDRRFRFQRVKYSPILTPTNIA